MNTHTDLSSLDGCQIPGLPRMSEGGYIVKKQPFIARLKSSLAVPWNYHVKKWLKRLYHWSLELRGTSKAQEAADTFAPTVPFEAGDRVRVRSLVEIQATLDPFKELKGCAFLDQMERYCNTEQRVFKVMTRFLDERDYKVKKVHGIILLEGLVCAGAAAFGRCDRSCFFFWREEWLEKLDLANTGKPV